MTEIWPTTTLESLYAEPSRNGLTRPKRVRGSGFPMINMGEIFAHDRISNIAMELVPMNEREINAFSVRPGDLLFARQSLVAAGAGKCSLVKSVSGITTFESHLIRVRLDEQQANPEFFFYYFISPEGKANVQSLVMQVAAAGIRGSELATLTVPVPPLEVQQRIAGILSAYDDLIENNQRRIKILKEMARSLYREWFVHFRYPGHEDVPLVDSPLGPIPQGWEVKALGKIAQFKSGFAFKSGTFVAEGEHRIVTIKNVQDGSFSSESCNRIDELPERLPGHCILSDGDILLSLTGNVGRVCLVHGGTFLLNQRVAKLEPVERFDNAFVYCMFRDSDMRVKLEMLSNGVAQQNLSPVQSAKMDVICPPSSLREKYSEMATPMIKQVIQSNVAIDKLKSMRDLLLPKLLSGQISVSEM